MLSAQLSQTSSETVTDTVQALWQALKSHLEEKRNEIHDEIKYYPPPIPACDQQFNYLLEQRTQIYQELRRANTILEENPTPDDALKAMATFMQASTFVDAAVKHQLLQHLTSLSWGHSNAAGTSE